MTRRPFERHTPGTRAHACTDAVETPDDAVDASAETEAVAAAQTAPSDAPRKSTSVLLVEDNPINALVAARMLERLGHRVVRANDGLEALEALEALEVMGSETVDLVLMDCQMPRMDGFAATRHIRQREAARAGSRLPIIAYTGSFMPDQVARCRDAGMDDLLPKPVAMKHLEEMLSRWLPS